MTPTSWIIILRGIVLALQYIVGPIVINTTRKLVKQKEDELSGASGTEKKASVMEDLKAEIEANDAIKKAPSYIYSMGIDIIVAELNLTGWK